jgi:hypothetical protein
MRTNDSPMLRMILKRTSLAVAGICGEAQDQRS